MANSRPPVTRRFGHRALVESAFLSALAVVITLLMEYAPIVGTLAALVSPVPVALVVSRHGLRWGIMSALAATLISMTLLNPIVALAVGLSLMLGGLALGYGIRQRLEASRTLVLMTIAGIVLIAVEFLISAYALGVGPETLVKQMAESIAIGLKQGADLAARLTGQLPGGLEPGATVETIALAVEGTLRQIIVGLIVTAAALNAYLNYVVSAGLLRRFHVPVSEVSPFSRWVLPPWLGLLFFLGTASTIAFAEQIDAYVPVRTAVLNVVVATSLFALVDGLSLLAFYLKRMRIPGALIALFGFYIIASPVLSTLAQMCGALDTMMDFRKLRWGDVEELL